jgi:hypothetical protein
MKDVTLRNGTVMTDEEFALQRGMGDTLTDFVATKADLKSLAYKLVDELLFDEFILLLQSSRADSNREAYTHFRLERVMAFLPELEPEIQEKLFIGREKNKEHAANLSAQWKAEAEAAEPVAELQKRLQSLNPQPDITF